MTTQFCYQQATAGFYMVGQLPQGFGRCCKMVKHHVEDDTIGADFSVGQCIGQSQLNVSQCPALAQAPRQFKHGRAAVHGNHLLEALRQFWQKAAVAGAYFQRRCLRTEAQFVEQRQQALAVLRQPCNQVLLGAKFLRSAGKKILAGQRALAMHQADTPLNIIGQA
ncbi:Predicted metal-dependent hydrolase [Pseudomonas syringae pv. actinidiae]|uniref:Predicted metal-dependent hydrolase n=1 Tax=Pseudomonas syringae pv. actinidiae TaxID=103796 RepID=A0A2V0Q409_PSESF|nr:Predicted metal-dependent hydrolase [Pseudomonas syringae pv. actinidiae]